MWEDEHPGIDVVPQIFYSANFYAERSVSIIQNHFPAYPPKTPLFLYLPIQSVHAPYQTPPEWETHPYPDMWDETYANMLHMLDVAVGNVTAGRNQFMPPTTLATENLLENTDGVLHWCSLGTAACHLLFMLTGRSSDDVIAFEGRAQTS